MTGRLIAFVGPSGAGKDTLIAATAAALPATTVVRRVITRPEASGGEPFLGVSHARFAEMQAAGAFALAWQAHGLSYGIPREVTATLASGTDALANLSRGVLAEAAARFGGMRVLNVTASSEVLEARLRKRGREDSEDIAGRLGRATRPLPAGIAAVEIRNDGTVDEALAAILSALQAERA